MIIKYVSSSNKKNDDTIKKKLKIKTRRNKLTSMPNTHMLDIKLSKWIMYIYI